MKIYGPKDRFKVSVESHGVAFVLSPLTVKQKSEVMSAVSRAGGNVVQDRYEMVRLAVKYAVKSAEGFETADGTPFVLSLDADGSVSDEGLDYLMNIPDTVGALFAASLQFIHGKPDEILDGETGKPLSGVTLAPVGKV